MGRPAIDLTGKRFEKLIVIKRVENSNDGHARWLCQCDCGNTITVSSNVLKKGNCKSCGCLRKEVASKKASFNYKDLTNQRFGKLIAKSYLGSSGKGSVLWLCFCDCGNNNFITTSHHLLSGNTQSCGCLKSKGEEKIKLILQQHNIIYEQEKTFSDLPLKRFDFYLPDFNLLIEYDGQQHFQVAFGQDKNKLILQQKYDKIKNEWCKENNIKLIRIPYYQKEITLQHLIQ